MAPFSVFISHGLLHWNSQLYLSVLSDTTFSVGFYSAAAALVYLILKRPDFFDRVLWLFAAFLMMCGTSHVMAIVSIWSSQPWLDGIFNTFTVAVSIATTVSLWRVVPKLLAMPSRTTVAEAAAQLATDTHRIGLTAIVDSSDDAIFSKDMDGLIHSWNRGAQRIFGYTAQEIVGQSVRILVPAEREFEEVEIFEKLGSGERIEHFETLRRRKDGQIIDVSITISPLQDSTGKIIGVATIAQDITARKESEKRFREVSDQAREAERNFDLALSVSRTGAWAWSLPEGKLDWDDQMYVLFGVTRDTFQPTFENVISCFHPDDRVLARNAMQTAIASSKEFYFEQRALWPDGTVHDIAARGRTVNDNNGKPIKVVCVCTDLTASKRSAELLQTNLRELERSNEDLQQFAYVCSHDLQEPLRVISNFTQLLAKRYKGSLDAKGDEYIAFIVDASKRMQGLIRDLLLYSRIHQQIEPAVSVNCIEIVETARSNLKVAITESGARFECEPLPIVIADRSQLLQLFQNLIANSVKFRSQQPLLIRISAEDQGNFWNFAVADNGVGIDMKYAEKVFVIFQRLHTREVYAGNGIGLGICKRIVERIGGRIWIESELGSGSCFHFTIPKTKEGIIL